MSRTNYKNSIKKGTTPLLKLIESASEYFVIYAYSLHINNFQTTLHNHQNE